MTLARRSLGHKRKRRSPWKAKMQRLTAREYQIAMLVGRGFSNKQVASKLRIGEGTVKVHVHKIFQKLRIRNRYGLFAVVALMPRPTGVGRPKNLSA
jgi:two-component system nitrate/nitrite response regulator NarL